MGVDWKEFFFEGGGGDYIVDREILSHLSGIL